MIDPGAALRSRQAGLLAALFVTGLMLSHDGARAGAPQTRPVELLPPQDPAPVPASSYSPAVMEAQSRLAAQVRTLAGEFGGKVGIAVRDVQTGWTTAYNGEALFPQQSVSKFWVAMTVLSKADAGTLAMDAPVTLRRDDLTLFHQPIREQVLRTGAYTTTPSDLLQRALQQSDNTANDFLMRRAGGPEAVRSFLADHQLAGIRFGPGERLLQSRTAGLEWKQSYSIGNAFYAARSALPMEKRRDALERYLADPVDGATPIGIVDALARLHKGELLSPASTQWLLGTMSHTKTGPQRLKGGLAPGWRLSHKTGTGQVLGATSTGYNDIGLLTAPDGRAYAVAVMIGRTTKPIPARFDLMQSVVRAVINYTDAMRGDG